MKAKYSVIGSGKAVVLLHGSMAMRTQWRPLIKELQQDYRIITMDLSGYGETPYPENPETYSLNYESDLLNEVLSVTLEEDEPYHLVGHSYGGAVALHHAYHQSQRVHSLIAIEPMSYHLLEDEHEYLLASEAMVEEISEDIATGMSMAGAQKFIDLWMSAGTFNRLSEQEKQVLSEGVKKMVLDFKAAKTEPLTTHDLTRLPRLFSLIAGKKSPPFSLCITKRIVRTNPNSELFWVDGGHFSPVSHAHQVNPLIYSLLKAADDHHAGRLIEHAFETLEN
jgi:pimeloyl-ACP methyl ester carboxylesterase